MVMPRLNPIVHLPLAEALVLRGKELGCRRGGSAAAAIAPGHRLGSSCGPLALPSPSFPLMQSKKLHNGGKNKWVLVEAVTWGCAFAVNVSDIQGSGQPGSEGQQPASGQMNLSQGFQCTCSSLEASLCSLVSPNESFWDKHIMLRPLKTSGSLLHRRGGHTLIALVLRFRRWVHSYFWDTFTVEGENCFGGEPKVECLPLWVPLCMCVLVLGREIKKKTVGRLKEQNCKMFALDCKGFFKSSLPLPRACGWD